ncbi:MAG: N-acetyltransferase [Verrucomicrobia bacterium]|nr:N-acetyltransferase [Verrucomicrobiota bacterium]
MGNGGNVGQEKPWGKEQGLGAGQTMGPRAPRARIFTWIQNPPTNIRVTPPPATLRRATLADVAAALAWSPTRESLQQWAGSTVRWPASTESLWADINAADATTFALDAPPHGLVGFGQVRYREKTFGHLARIIVSPRHRGSGFGRVLCRALMREAPRLHNITCFTLYVFTDNPGAIALYHSLGFEDKNFHPDYPNVMLMEAPLHTMPVEEGD